MNPWIQLGLYAAAIAVALIIIAIFFEPEGEYDPDARD